MMDHRTKSGIFSGELAGQLFGLSCTLRAEVGILLLLESLPLVKCIHTMHKHHLGSGKRRVREKTLKTDRDVSIFQELKRQYSTLFLTSHS